MLPSASSVAAAAALQLCCCLAVARASPAPSHQTVPQKRFLHITDVHYDPFYVANSDVSTQCHRRGEDAGSGAKAERALHFGTRGSICDSPMAMIQDAFASIQRDVVGTQQPPDVVFWTGDSSRHDRDTQFPKEEDEVYAENSEVVYWIEKTFDLGRTAVIPAIGNWDVFPHNFLSDHATTAFSKLYLTWKPVLEIGLDESEVNRTRSTFLTGGWFDRNIGMVKDKVALRAFSMNTMTWFAENMGTEDCSPYMHGEAPQASTTLGDAQLAWLWTELEAARANNQKAILIGHVPPTDSNDQALYRPQCLAWFTQMSGEFSDVILSQYYGHVNKDIVNLVLRPRKGKSGNDSQHIIKAVTSTSLSQIDLDANSIVGNFKTSGSIVPVHNPTLKAGLLAVEAGSTKIIQESQWYIDLNHANERYAASPSTTTLKFREACRTDKDYSMSALDPAGYTEWIIRMQADSVSALAKKKKRDHPLRTYQLCIDSNIKAPRADTDSHLSLSPAVVRSVLIVAGLLFVGSLGGFYIYVKQLENQGDVLERQRLLFRGVEPDRLRRAQRVAGRVRETGLDAQNITI
ncbi:Metallo-dependent phosphatase-like protein [Geranomyces variabilis]|nr:Metallo-dependent phosphatase-like protein [Geranomyces variabilis]KAJ3136055.1 Acid sphingomyelinase-like phosphodiesterase 3b [Geranomyces variabilis]